MKRKKKQLPEWDDGRTVANMNVEGMPWYHPDSGKEVKEEDKPTRKEKRVLKKQRKLEKKTNVA